MGKKEKREKRKKEKVSKVEISEKKKVEKLEVKKGEIYSADTLADDDFAPPKSRMLYGEESISIIFDGEEGEDKEIEEVQKNVGKKRKNRENDDEEDEKIQITEVNNETTTKILKKAKIDNKEEVVRKPKQKKNKIAKEGEEIGLSKVQEISSLPSLSSFFWEKLCQTLSSSLSPVEKDDSLSASNFVDVNKVTGVETRDLKGLNNFITKYFPNYKKKFNSKVEKGGTPREKGAPLILIVTSAANRCPTIIQSIRDRNIPHSNFVKLFAKHIKEKEQKEALDTIVNIGVGTPHRIAALAAKGILKLSSCELLIVDSSINLKKQTIFDIKEIAGDFFQLYHSYCHARTLSKSMKICLY